MTELTAGQRAKPVQVFAYFAPLTLFVYLAAPNAYLIDIATAFMLKDRLHASANDVAMFRLLTGLPLYFAFVFGFARDLWNPFGLRDRGFFVIFASLTSLVFFWLAFNHLTYVGLAAGMVLAMLSYRFVAAAYEGSRRDGAIPASCEIIYGHAWKTAPRRIADGRQVIDVRRPPR